MSEAERLADDLRRQFMNDDYNFDTMIEASIELRRLSAIESQGVPDAADLIAGALYDFLGHLTSMEKSIAFGANEWSTPAVDALVQFAEKRRLTLNNPAIEKWTESLPSAPPAPQASVVQQEPVAWMHECRKKPSLREVSLKKNEPSLAAKGYIARPLGFLDANPAQQAKPLSNYEWDEVG